MSRSPPRRLCSLSRAPGAAEVAKHIEDEVERPAFIDAGRCGQAWDTAGEAPPSLAPTDGKALMRVEAVDALEVHGKGLAPEQDVEPAIAEPAPLAGQVRRRSRSAGQSRRRGR
jgi:hypothetical protein